MTQKKFLEALKNNPLKLSSNQRLYCRLHHGNLGSSDEMIVVATYIHFLSRKFCILYIEYITRY